MSNELFIEISGSSNKAVSTLDKVIAKLGELQNKLSQSTQKINQFSNSLRNIPKPEGLKNLANGIRSVATALQRFDNKMALSNLRNELEQIKRSTNGLEVTAGKLESIGIAINKIPGGSKLSSAVQKIAENAKWAEEAQKSLNDAVARAVKNNNVDASNTLTGPLRPPVKLQNYNQYRNVQAEIDAIGRTDNPEFDNSKIKAAVAEVNELVKSLTPNIENMSLSAQNKFEKMAEKLTAVNVELERQKQLYVNLTEDFATLSKGFSPEIADSQHGFTEKIQSASEKIEELTFKSEALKNSMQKLAQPTENFTKKLDKTTTSAKKATNQFSTFDRVIRNLRTYLIIRAMNEVSKAFSNALQDCINFTENMNLFNVSLGENAEMAGQFIDKMSRAFGMDASGLVKTMGTFYQISHSMGVTSKNAYVLSENFTKLANDLSSFYNIPVNDAVVKLQAGLVGETEPLRRLGIIVTENALKQTAANLGIQKSVESMSEAEKMHLRYITVLEQTKNIQGDFARTIDNPAQSLKILGEQIAQLGRAIGSVFMPVLGAVLPYLIAFARAITTVISGLAAFLGYKAPAYQNVSSGFSGVTSETDKLGDSIGRASAKAKEFKKLIMGFDELHILAEPKQPASGSGAGGVGGGDFAVPDLTGYDNLMDSITSKTDEIYKNIMAFFESVGKLLEPTIAAFSRLQVELDRLGQFMWQGLVDFYNLFLVPVGNWVFGEGLPRFIDALTNGLASVSWSKITDSAQKFMECAHSIRHHSWRGFALVLGKGSRAAWRMDFEHRSSGIFGFDCRIYQLLNTHNQRVSRRSFVVLGNILKTNCIMDWWCYLLCFKNSCRYFKWNRKLDERTSGRYR